MIKLNDILKIDNATLENVKVRLMTVPSDDPQNNPLEHYKRNPDEVTTKWFLWKQEKQGRPFQVGQIGIGLLNIDKDKWLLVTIKEIVKELEKTESGVHYEAEEIKEYSKFFGRVVIKYHNEVQMLNRKSESIMDELEVFEIMSTYYEGDDFPGYENVTLSWDQLYTIIDRGKKDWITALKNQKGVYLITDKKNGKQYVGSAYGEEMILQRWHNYIENGHGGTKEIKELVKRNGLDYIKKNFQYSILEIYKNNTADDLIRNRESWWKNALCSRVFGYNAN
ncbi:MAG: hypothetical protein Ta2B_16840 [Termitinemataceae bacterium]|nr:MAG: hypothetical protein Ta2B_16840 [Termitinemataceae bacterium]